MVSFEEAMKRAGISRDEVEFITATGYGRNNVSFAHDTKTEIACHSRGCYHYFPEAITVVDVGGQDSKIIRLDAQGHRISFKMNRKCAAGTGSFLEEIAYKLDIPLDNLDGLARDSRQETTIGSYCTVFTATEVLDKIRAGEKVEDIVKGLFRSVVKRITEMDVLTGRPPILRRWAPSAQPCLPWNLRGGKVEQSGQRLLSAILAGSGESSKIRAKG
jgi:predicted CoA-substrate-specific enzyme activase